MHTLIKAACYLAGWVRGLFVRAKPREVVVYDQQPTGVIRIDSEWFMPDERGLFTRNPGATHAYSGLDGDDNIADDYSHMNEACEHAEYDDLTEFITGHTNAMLERLEREEFGDSTDQIARGDG